MHDLLPCPHSNPLLGPRRSTVSTYFPNIGYAHSYTVAVHCLPQTLGLLAPPRSSKTDSERANGLGLVLSFSSSLASNLKSPAEQRLELIPHARIRTPTYPFYPPNKQGTYSTLFRAASPLCNSEIRVLCADNRKGRCRFFSWTPLSS